MPAISEQNPGVNCGLYAIAYVVQFCEGKLKNIVTQNFTFDESKMREHL